MHDEPAAVWTGHVMKVKRGLRTGRPRGRRIPARRLFRRRKALRRTRTPRDPHLRSANASDDSAPAVFAQPIELRQQKSPGLRGSDDGTGERMAAVPLERRHERQHTIARP